MKSVYGLTGGIASGKSTVTTLLRERGARVVDADVLARAVVAPGSEGLQAVVDAFGTDILTADGQLDRPALGARVFADPAARARLDGILHPRIAQASAQALAEAQQQDGAPIFYDAALLVEQGTWRMFDGLVVVACDPEIQLQRVMARDGFSAEQARARIAAQAPQADKLAVATHVLWNNTTREALATQVDELLHALRAVSA